MTYPSDFRFSGQILKWRAKGESVETTTTEPLTLTTVNAAKREFLRCVNLAMLVGTATPVSEGCVPYPSAKLDEDGEFAVVFSRTTSTDDEGKPTRLFKAAFWHKDPVGVPQEVRP